MLPKFGRCSSQRPEGGDPVAGAACGGLAAAAGCPVQVRERDRTKTWDSKTRQMTTWRLSWQSCSGSSRRWTTQALVGLRSEGQSSCWTQPDGALRSAGPRDGCRLSAADLAEMTSEEHPVVPGVKVSPVELNSLFAELSVLADKVAPFTAYVHLRRCVESLREASGYA